MKINKNGKLILLPLGQAYNPEITQGIERGTYWLQIFKISLYFEFNWDFTIFRASANSQPETSDQFVPVCGDHSDMQQHFLIRIQRGGGGRKQPTIGTNEAERESAHKLDG